MYIPNDLSVEVATFNVQTLIITQRQAIPECKDGQNDRTQANEDKNCICYQVTS